MIDPALEAHLRSSVASVEAPDGSVGTGFVALANGVVVTNAHVVGYFPEVTLRFQDPALTIQARVIDVDVAEDVALLLPQRETNRAPLQLADSSRAALGQVVYAVGNPLGLTFTVTRGVVSCSRRKLLGRELIQTDAAINSGNSGGPLIDETGAVLGVSSLSLLASEGISFAVPTHAFFERLRAVAGDPRALAERRPEYLCVECKAPFGIHDELCPTCGRAVPYRRTPGVEAARGQARAARLVNELVTKLGHDPTLSRVRPDCWRLGEVAVLLAPDGSTVSFLATVAKIPPHHQEALFRFLLTYSDESSNHSALALSPDQEVVLHFSESTAFLNVGEVSRKLGRLLRVSASLRDLLAHNFGASPAAARFGHVLLVDG